MLDKIDGFDSAIDFVETEIIRIFDEFKIDYLVEQDSKLLTRKINNDDFENVKGFILNRMK